MQRSALCRSRRELSNAYLLAKIGVDTAENEPLEVWGENSIQYSLHSLVLHRSTGHTLEGSFPAVAKRNRFVPLMLSMIKIENVGNKRRGQGTDASIDVGRTRQCSFRYLMRNYASDGDDN